jgi:putative hydrolase of the HAD superfamily
LARHFKLCLCSTEVGLAKPDPAIFELALQQASCPPDKVVMIGDRIDNDIRPAKAAGWQTIRLQAGYAAGQQPRTDADRADVTVTSLPELLSYL